MFCSKCGNKNEDGAQFCSNCGAPIEKINVVEHPQVEHPQVENPQVENPQVEHPQVVQPQAQPQAVQPQSTQPQYQSYQPIPPTTTTPNKNLSKYIGIGAVALVAILLIVFVSSLFGGYSNKTPEKATLSFFKAVSKQDIDEVMNLMEKDTLEAMIELSGSSKKEFKEMLEEGLSGVDEEGEDEYGKNWHKKVKVVDVDEEDGYAEVTVEIGDDEETMYLYESKGKWYINFYDMF